MFDDNMKDQNEFIDNLEKEFLNVRIPPNCHLCEINADHNECQDDLDFVEDIISKSCSHDPMSIEEEQFGMKINFPGEKDELYDLLCYRCSMDLNSRLVDEIHTLKMNWDLLDKHIYRLRKKIKKLEEKLNEKK